MPLRIGKPTPDPVRPQYGLKVDVFSRTKRQRGVRGKVIPALAAPVEPDASAQALVSEPWEAADPPSVPWSAFYPKLLKIDHSA
jgi:hypothetical protein